MDAETVYKLNIPMQVDQKYQSNYISTTKYNILTFIPHALIIQFKRYANIYFLVTAILQSIPLISPLSPFSAVAPLAFVLSLSMLRQGYEDYQRYIEDKKCNASQCQKRINGNFQVVEWKNIIPTDIVKIMEGEIFPADVIPLVSSLNTGIIYLETCSLDGQKNLKPKNSLKESQLMYNQNQQIIQIQGTQIICTQPNGLLYQYQGSIFFKSINKYIQLTQKNLLLRGAKLKNTNWIIGLVVYTGKNTKIMKNANQGTTKISNIQSMVNRLILIILLLELICCMASSVYCYFLCLSEINFQNLISSTGPPDCPDLALISFSSYFILNNTMIPISLIVSLQFVKVFQGYFMQRDKQMQNIQNGRKLKCNTVSINEQLGQIEYILTDKTGTLTCNKMVFKQIAIGNEIYGIADDPRDLKRQSILTLRQMQRIIKLNNSKAAQQSFDVKGIQYELSKPYMNKMDSIEIQTILNDKKKLIEEMFYIITTCHQCIKQQKTQKYQGPSPDEVTLVQAARQFGFQYLSTQNKTIFVKYKEKKIQFQLIQLFQFNSDRKRMSVVIKHNGILKLYVKGADSTILPRLSKNQKYKEYLNERIHEMSKKGLRSLMYAFRILPNQLLSKFPLTADIEQQLTLIGITGIEDKLQDFVPQTIAALRSGGIKFVLLTGDKLETAENISRSCGLIEQSIILNSDEKYKLVQTYKILQKNPNLSLIVDGSKININQNKQIFAQILLTSQSTIFCRVTPNQKAEVVKMVKNSDKRTLAIGDGANDVNMILQAHVGVGIYGEQGIRAAQVSNYAIGEFCLLWKLLLHHGRLNYMRISQMILYFFYKNMVFTIPQFVYSFYCMGSGSSVYSSWAITFYNMTFTFFPVVLRAVFETDLYIDAEKKKLMSIKQDKQTIYQHYPKMYYIGQKNIIFTPSNFFSWFLLGTLQGILCLIINIYGLTNVRSNSGYNSYQTGFYFMEISLLTSILIVVNFKLAINVQQWNWLLVLGFTIPTLGAYVLYAFLTNNLQSSPMEGFTTDLLTMPNFYFVQILSILGMFSLDLLLFSIQNTKDNLENYIKYNWRSGNNLSEKKIDELNMQAKKLKRNEKKNIKVRQIEDWNNLAHEYLNQELISNKKFEEVLKKYPEQL